MVPESEIVDQELSSRQIGLLKNISILKNTLSQIEGYFKAPMCPPTAIPSREVLVIVLVFIGIAFESAYDTYYLKCLLPRVVYMCTVLYLTRPDTFPVKVVSITIRFEIDL